MRWGDERYVRLYTRDTIEWNMLPWESKALWPLILRKLDRAGLLDLGKHGARGLAVMVGLPSNVVEPGLAGLIEDGCLVINGTTIVVPNFIEAQESPSSDAMRKREQRARDRAAKLGQRDTEDGQRDASAGQRDATVTTGHSSSQVVTPCCSDPCLEEPSAENPADGLPETEPEEITPAPATPNAKAHDITRLAEQGELTGEMLAAAMRQKKLGKKRRPLYDGAVTGTMLRLRGQYVAQRGRVKGQSRTEAEEACKRGEALLKRAAENVLELGVSVERYLDVAFDTKPMKLAFPPLQHLAGPMMLDKVPAWVPPAERMTQDKNFDPAEHTPIEISAEERALLLDDPMPVEVPGEDLEVMWAKTDAYRAGKAEGKSNDEIRAMIAAAEADALARLDDESATRDDEETAA